MPNATGRPNVASTSTRVVPFLRVCASATDGPCGRSKAPAEPSAKRTPDKTINLRLLIFISLMKKLGKKQNTGSQARETISASERDDKRLTVRPRANASNFPGI